MGQIIGRTAKPDACNLRSLSSFGTPAAGQHILVSTDNSAMENGQGNFDAYVVGNGTTVAANLPLNYAKEDDIAKILSLQGTSISLNWQVGQVFGNAISTTASYRFALFTPAKNAIVEVKATYTPASTVFLGTYNGRGGTAIIQGNAKAAYTRFVADGSTYIICNLNSYIDGVSVKITSTELEGDEFVRYNDFEKIMPVFSYDPSVANYVEIANSLIKKVEVIGTIENYQVSQLRIKQLYYFYRAEGISISWLNQFVLIQNASQIWIDGFTIHLNAEPLTEEIITTSEHLRVTWNAKALWNYGTSTSETVYSENATISRLVLKTVEDIENETKEISPNALPDGGIDFEKLSPPVQEMLNKVGTANGFMTGKKLVTLCDSLGTAGTWQEKLAKLTGCVFNQALNYQHYSYGGTASLNVIGNSGQERARLLVEENEIVPDIIFIENVNEQFNVGTTADEPFFLTSKITLSSITGLTTLAAARTYWDNNFASIVGGLTPTIGQMLLIPFTSTSFTLTITSAPSAAGTFAITLGDSGTKYVNVLATDTIANVVAKIAEYAYENYTCTASGSSVVFKYVGSGTPSIEVDAGATGITSTNTTSSPTSNFGTVFLGHDVSKWNTASQWKYVNFNNYAYNITLMSIYKGMVEYLQANFPKAMIYFIMPKTYQFNWNNYKRADGTIDYDAVIANCSYQKWLFDGQVAFCEYYEIPYVDLRKDTCLTPANLSTFMVNNNVHPQAAAYIRWAEVIAQQIG